MNQYNFSNLISGRHYDRENYEWVDSSNEFRSEALDKFKEFLLPMTRKGSIQDAIKRLSLDNLPNSYGILERLCIDLDTGRTFYIAGQDYDYEMRTIKGIFRDEC